MVVKVVVGGNMVFFLDVFIVDGIFWYLIGVYWLWKLSYKVYVGVVVQVDVFVVKWVFGIGVKEGVGYVGYGQFVVVGGYKGWEGVVFIYGDSNYVGLFWFCYV